jgi:hypothetical protein
MFYGSIDMPTVSLKNALLSVPSDRRFARISCCSVDTHTASLQCEFLNVPCVG